MRHEQNMKHGNQGSKLKKRRNVKKFLAFQAKEERRDDYWNDPRYMMYGFQDQEDLIKDMKKDHIRLNKEVADLVKVACNTKFDRQDKNKQ